MADKHPLYDFLDDNLGPKDTVVDLVPYLNNDKIVLRMIKEAKILLAKKRGLKSPAPR